VDPSARRRGADAFELDFDFAQHMGGFAMTTAMIFVIPLALLLAAGFVYAFIRAIEGGQFDDLSTPAHRILHDEEKRFGKEN
jgi:cbb3-type cytochrome oxidase maturation protein